MVNLFDYMRGLTDILGGKLTPKAKRVLAGLTEEREYHYKLNVELKSNIINVSSSLPISLLPDTLFSFFESRVRALAYTVIVSYEWRGELKRLEKVAPIQEDPSRLLKSMLQVPMDKIEEVTIKTKKFEIQYNLKGYRETLTVKLPNPDLARSIFIEFLHLVFPYLHVPKNSLSMQADITFKVISSIPKQIHMTISTSSDNSPLGVKTAHFRVRGV
ncbi:MAG TPA: hypothetical protein ENG01_00695 [Candidatus Aenigmarchaeota archaeon]|nr:hypothetical protein [Candidatus Aenigmarchaeota archaeon]HEX32914.1 hypothetical protein [Candidatus Aenigmarchaeota archaeon]